MSEHPTPFNQPNPAGLARSYVDLKSDFSEARLASPDREQAASIAYR